MAFLLVQGLGTEVEMGSTDSPFDRLRASLGGCPHTGSAVADENGQNDCFIFDFTLCASFSICWAFLMASTDMTPWPDFSR